MAFDPTDPTCTPAEETPSPREQISSPRENLSPGRSVAPLLAAAMMVFGIGMLSAPTGGCLVTPTATAAHGDHLFTNYCAPCHGSDGHGKPEVAAPSIAGLPEWYVTEQLTKFRKRLRAYHFDDIEGMRMRPMSLTLRTETDVTAVSMYVASLAPAPKAEPVVQGSADKGKALFATCSACHGPEAKGNEQLGAPSLLVQQDWYLQTQIHKFRSGVRGAEPADVRGGQMRPMAASLPDEQAVDDVVSYIQTLRQ